MSTFTKIPTQSYQPFMELTQQKIGRNITGLIASIMLLLYANPAFGVAMLFVAVLLSIHMHRQFPTQAVNRIVTFSLRRPQIFRWTAVSAMTPILFSSMKWWLGTDVQFHAQWFVPSLGFTLNNFDVALLLAVLVCVTSMRYTMNAVQMYHSVLLLVVAWGGSTIVQDGTLLTLACTYLYLRMLWAIQSLWNPVLSIESKASMPSTLSTENT